MTHHPPDVRVIQVVEVAFVRGEGTEQDIARRVTRYYSLDNVMLAENDPCLPHVRHDGRVVVPEEALGAPHEARPSTARRPPATVDVRSVSGDRDTAPGSRPVGWPVMAGTESPPLVTGDGRGD